jgi:argininosuccinate lyase
MSKKLWGGRFSAHTQSDVEQYLSSIHFDAELAYEDILGSMAHADMLARCKIISKSEGEKLQQGLRKIMEKIIAGEVEFKVEDEDVHMNIERLLTEIVGDEAGKLHTARSRNDQVALDMHLYVRKQIIGIVHLLMQLQLTFIQKAERHKSAILPGYTHLQRAQPILLGQHFLAYVSMFSRDCERLKSAWDRVNRSPLGAAALAGTRFPTNPQHVATILGFDAVYTNSLDAVADRDFVVEFLAAASLIMTHLSRLSEELILWSSQEFDFIRMDDAYSTGSSIMPQKKNPDVAELARGKTGRVYGALFSVLTLLKGLPLAYNKDMQEDKEPVFDTVKTLVTTLTVFRPLLETLHINADKMHKAAEEGFLNATDLADYLAQSGIPFRTAHHITGKMVSYCLDKKCRLEDLSLEEMRQFSPHITDEIYPVLSVENIIAVRNVQKEAMFNTIETQLLEAKDRIAVDQQWVAEKQNLLSTISARFGL